MIVADLNDYDFDHLPQLQKHQLCAFVLSTYGDGDPPDNTNNFWNTLHRLQADNSDLGSLRYVIFGLGNSNYRQFNRVADEVDTLLNNMGAIRYGEAGRGDDANGTTENDFSSWQKRCEDTLKNELDFKEQDSAYRPSFHIYEDPITAADNMHLGEPYPTTSSQHQGIKPMTISSIYKLWEGEERLCIHADIDLGNDRMIKYKTGDHLAIWPSNASHEVERLLSALGLRDKLHTPITIEAADGIGGGKLPVPSPTTIHALFCYYLEISAPLAADTVANLAAFAPSDAARDELRRISERHETFQEEVTASHATLADILEKVDGEAQWRIPLSFLLERLKPMKPRYYSISSSTVVQPRKVSITAVINITPSFKHGRETLFRGCHGVTTAYLHALEKLVNSDDKISEKVGIPTFELSGPGMILEGGKVFGQIRQSRFKLPTKASSPVIMFGAGTGVAPFRAFIQERARRKQLGHLVGKTLLFMGFRHSKLDFIYEREWHEWREIIGSDVFKFWTAFSRDADNEKIYIQDRVRENMQEVMNLLEGSSRCYVYICGSAAMARDVVRTLTVMKMVYSDVDEQQATSWLKQMHHSNQLLEDVWG